MALSNKISNLVGNYNSLSFPVLGVFKLRDESNFLVNDNFRKTFLSDNKEDLHQEIIKNHISRLKDHSKFHHKGNIYQVDEVDLVKGVKYYFYSLSNKSVHHSFLWLKHDLLNILNPIMGFSDVLEESDTLNEEDQILVKKIKNNSNKLYDQIQKLALLQNLDINNNQNTGAYEISDFIYELKNQLIANNIFEGSSKTEIAHQGKVSARIIQSDFRSTLEEHLEYLSKFQKIKDIKILSVFNNQFFNVIIQLPECQPPSSYNEMIEEVDHFILKCQPIQKLQLSTLNYLILNELCDSFGGKIYQKKIKNDIVIELNLPSLSKENEIKNIKASEKETLDFIPRNNIFKDMPDELFQSIRKACIKFDGLIILDEWQNICNRLIEINNIHHDSTLKKIIDEIQIGINSFDVERLRNIYNQCHQELKK